MPILAIFERKDLVAVAADDGVHARLQVKDVATGVAVLAAARRVIPIA